MKGEGEKERGRERGGTHILLLCLLPLPHGYHQVSFPSPCPTCRTFAKGHPTLPPPWLTPALPCPAPGTFSHLPSTLLQPEATNQPPA